MKKEDKVSKIMTEDVITVDINDSLQEVNNVFRQVKIRHIPVMAQNTLIGIISQTDILRISFGSSFGEDQLDADEAIFDMLSVNQVMKHSPVTVSADQTILGAAKIFANNEFHALPVTRDNELVGILTTTDILKYFIEELKVS
ncbi:MAG: CBS domain-containing protein [Cyclobacteriaceae bacterium]